MMKYPFQDENNLSVSDTVEIAVSNENESEITVIASDAINEENTEADGSENDTSKEEDDDDADDDDDDDDDDDGDDDDDDNSDE